MKAVLHCVVVSLVLSLTSFSAHASCLEQAAAFAERICGEISNKGSSRLVSGSGELTAEAQGIVARILGNARGSAKVEAATSSYENVIREELAKEHKDRRGCAERMASVGVAQECNKRPEMKIACTGEFEGSCPGPRHDLFYTCGYFGTDQQIADGICEGAKYRRLKTVKGNNCGYSLIEILCP